MRILVRSYGCSANQADGAVLTGCLAREGYELVDSISAAEVVVYNTCAVKGPTENRMIEALRRVPKEKRLIIAGCLPMINNERLIKEVRFDGLAGPAAGETIVETVKRVLSGEKSSALEGSLDNKPQLMLPRLQSSSVRSVIPISYGCMGSCAYCCVVHARGPLRSYTIPEIVERATEDVHRGFRELWLTAQDAACYGKDLGTNLAELLEAVCEIDGDFYVRVGMMTPNMAMNIIEDFSHAFRHPKIFKFLHLPVQSGDNDVLRKMRRFYSVDDFREIVQKFRVSFSESTFATDVICGFPSETREAFENTLTLLREVKPDIVNVSKFFVRPRTPATQMQKDFVPLQEIKARSAKAGALAKTVAQERNNLWIGWKGEILIDEVGKISGSWVGRNSGYKPVTVNSSDNLLGKTLPVRVTEAFPTYLKGEIVG
jgi:MiaB-like tRNA modifying enzyme